MPVIKSIPEVVHAIVGTAGHVDHGKTSLVRLLTGCETDRLPEEKARGMSIDLGFAPCLLSGQRIVGIVDVPGHRDFIRNMVAGAASIDVLLLVVAADDGVMPQTDEHLKIVRLLRRPLVMVALTKIDLVEPAMLDLAEQDVRALLARMGFEGAPIVRVSNRTGEGIGEVRDTMQALVERVRRHGDDRRAFRLNIERVFSVKGYGTVVTGIPLGGRIGVGEKLELLPGGRGLTVRTIQCYKHDSDTAWANTCCAINVRDVEAGQTSRGMTIAAPGVYESTREAIVTLHNAADDRQGFKRRFTALLHSGTGVTEASIKLLDMDVLPHGREALAHLVLAEPACLAAGDRFILRAVSPARTLGGGTVLSAQAPKWRKATLEVLERLNRAAAAIRADDVALAALLAGPRAIVDRAELARLTQSVPPAADETIRRLETEGHIADLGGDWLIASRLPEIETSLLPVLQRHHAAHPYDWGMTPAHACEFLGIEIRGFEHLSKLFVRTGRVAVKHGRLALASFQPPVSARLIELRDQVLRRIRAPPA